MAKSNQIVGATTHSCIGWMTVTLDICLCTCTFYCCESLSVFKHDKTRSAILFIVMSLV